MGDESSLSQPPVKNWTSALWVGAMVVVLPFAPAFATEGVKLAGAVGELAEWAEKRHRERLRRRANAMAAELDAANATIDLESEVDAVTLREAVRVLHDALDDAAMPPLGRLLGASLRKKRTPDGFQRSLARVLCDLSHDELVAARDLFEAVVAKAPTGATQAVMSESEEGGALVGYRGAIDHAAKIPAAHYRRVQGLMLTHGVLSRANVLTKTTLSAAFAEMDEVHRIRDVLRAVKVGEPPAP